MVENKKEVLNYCPNFNQIVNFEYAQDDKISGKLIRIYKDYICHLDITTPDDVKHIQEIDYVLGRYIEDYAFRRELKAEIIHVKIRKTCTEFIDILKAIVASIIHIFDNYLENSTRKIRIARWI